MDLVSPTTPAASPAPEPVRLKAGATVRVQCDGYIYEGSLLEDEGDGKTVKVRHLGEVARTRLV